MNEDLKLRKEKDMPVFVELIDKNGEYVKSRAYKVERWGFYLRFCGEWFLPCKEDQERLKNIVLGSSRITIGNKDYREPIELSMSFELPDEPSGWIEVERRKPTAEELKKLDRYDR